MFSSVVRIQTSPSSRTVVPAPAATTALRHIIGVQTVLDRQVQRNRVKTSAGMLRRDRDGRQEGRHERLGMVVVLVSVASTGTAAAANVAVGVTIAILPVVVVVAISVLPLPSAHLLHFQNAPPPRNHASETDLSSSPTGPILSVASVWRMRHCVPRSTQAVVRGSTGVRQPPYTDARLGSPAVLVSRLITVPSSSGCRTGGRGSEAILIHVALLRRRVWLVVLLMLVLMLSVAVGVWKMSSNGRSLGRGVRDVEDAHVRSSRWRCATCV